MQLTVKRETDGYVDESGNWVPGAQAQTIYEIEERQFQPGVRTGYYVVSETALISTNHWTLFLHNNEDVQEGDIVEIDGKEYEVVRIFNYERHKEVILYEETTQ